MIGFGRLFAMVMGVFSLAACIAPQGGEYRPGPGAGQSGAGCDWRGCAPAGAGAAILDVRIQPIGRATRVSIDADRPIDPQIFWLASGGDRMVLDLPRVEWRLSGDAVGSGQRAGPGGGDVLRYRYADFSADTSRIVFDLLQPLAPTAQSGRTERRWDGGHTYILELRPEDPARFAATAGRTQNAARPDRQAYAARTAVAPAPSPVAQSGFTDPRRMAAPQRASGGPQTLSSPPPTPVSAPAPRRRDGRFVVVIDPGHGGRDSGAVSRSGVREKDVNLAVARRLREQLAASRRYDVVMTRDADVFIELADRVDFARRAGADLFISLHADSLAAGNRVKGASVYTISEAAKGRAQSEILSDNNWIIGVDPMGRSDLVNGIILDMTHTATRNQSDFLAELLIPQLKRVGPVLRNTHRTAGFYVLLAPDVPAVLVETGFLSNADDARRISSAREQDRIARAITRGIDAYFAERTRVLAQR